MSNAPEERISYSIKVGSKTLDPECPIQSIVIDKHINKIPYARIVLYDGDMQSQTFSIADGKTFEIGAAITIQAGYGTTLSTLFEGLVAKLAVKSRTTGAPTLLVTCRDVAYKTTLTPKTMHFVKSKDSDLLKKILGTYSGLKNKLETTATTHESITQYELTDWDFLNIRAEANGQIVLVNNGEISVKKPKTTGKGSVTYVYGEDFMDFDIETDAREPWTGAAAISWDSNKQTIVSSKASDPGERSMGNLSYKKLTSATNQSPVSIAHAGLANPEIKTLADGLLDRSRIAKIKGTMTVRGNPKLLHDNLIAIQKGAAHFSGDAYVSGIRHMVTPGTWQTELTLGLEAKRYVRQYSDIGSLPAAGTMAPMHGLHIGIVKQIAQDPQKNERLFVHLPLVQSNPKEGIWCRLASFYATQKSGAFFIPEIEDEVVVGFVNDDVRAPIILGSLYSGKHAPPNAMDAKNLIKSFVSREKLELTFHDNKDGPEIRIKTPKGGLIQLSDKNKGIEIVDQNNNKIVLDSSGITLSSSKDIVLDAKGSITLKSIKDVVLHGTQNVNLKSMNINAQASMKASLSGNACTEVKSSMTTLVKGTTVLIN